MRHTSDIWRKVFYSTVLPGNQIQLARSSVPDRNRGHQSRKTGPVLNPPLVDLPGIRLCYTDVRPSWLPTVDTLRNLFLVPTTEMLTVFPTLRDVALYRPAKNSSPCCNGT